GSESVLMTAEIIGFAYYTALREATGSPTLRAICDTFLRDEAAHLVFHAEQLSRLSQAPGRLGNGLVRTAAQGPMAGGGRGGWGHGGVLEGGGLTFAGFARGCHARLALAFPARSARVRGGPTPACTGAAPARAPSCREG